MGRKVKGIWGHLLVIVRNITVAFTVILTFGLVAPIAGTRIRVKNASGNQRLIWQTLVEAHQPRGQYSQPWISP